MSRILMFILSAALLSTAVQVRARRTHGIDGDGVATRPADPNPAPGASNWKTYRSEKFAFEVRYPPGLRPEIPQNSPSSVGFIDPKLDGTDCYEFQVEVEPRKAMSREKTIQKSGLFYTKEQAQSFYHDNPGLGAFPFATAPEDAYFIGGGVMDPDLHRVKETRVNGYFALIGKTWTRCYYKIGGIAGSGDEKVVFLLGKQHYASIEIFWENADSDKMLSTFKFVGPAGSAAFQSFEVPRSFADFGRVVTAPGLCRGPVQRAAQSAVAAVCVCCLYLWKEPRTPKSEVRATHF